MARQSSTRSIGRRSLRVEGGPEVAIRRSPGNKKLKANPAQSTKFLATAFHQITVVFRLKSLIETFAKRPLLPNLPSSLTRRR